MNSLRFHQNPAGVDHHLVVLPRRVYFSFTPRPLFPQPGVPDSETTTMILGSQAFVLVGDYRSQYEAAMFYGGVEACIVFYESMKHSAGSAWSSPCDPRHMAALAWHHHAVLAAPDDHCALAA